MSQQGKVELVVVGCEEEDATRQHEQNNDGEGQHVHAPHDGLQNNYDLEF